MHPHLRIKSSPLRLAALIPLRYVDLVDRLGIWHHRLPRPLQIPTQESPTPPLRPRSTSRTASNPTVVRDQDVPYNMPPPCFYPPLSPQDLPPYPRLLFTQLQVRLLPPPPWIRSSPLFSPSSGRVTTYTRRVHLCRKSSLICGPPSPPSSPLYLNRRWPPPSSSGMPVLSLGRQRSSRPTCGTYFLRWSGCARPGSLLT